MCSCDIADSPSFYSEETHKARKEHRCIECPFPILPGEKYVACSGKWDGDVTTHKRHLECHEASHIEEGCMSAFGCVREDIRDCGPLPKKHRSRNALAKLLWRFRRHPKARDARLTEFEGKFYPEDILPRSFL
jgi:hypothetical protein